MMDGQEGMCGFSTHAPMCGLNCKQWMENFLSHVCMHLLGLLRTHYISLEVLMKEEAFWTRSGCSI